jgi:nicotinate-nucleotide--dimethylbenzimidazole phosphoribosyltransferase
MMPVLERRSLLQDFIFLTYYQKPDMTIQEALQQKIDNKTKPPGALGLLEEVAQKVGFIQNTTSPSVLQPHIVVFAGDHGIATTGLVNPYPQAVTAQMVKTFLSGGAAINVFCRQHRLQLIVVDAGVNAEWSEAEQNHANFQVRKIAYGTQNYLQQPAMTAAQCETAIASGGEVVRQLAAAGCNTIGFGEMGISNTSSASLLMSALLGCDVQLCIGRGTGADDVLLQQKLETLQKVAMLHQINTLGRQPLELLQCVGGFEIAMMTGAYLEAAEQKMTIVVDGFIATAALLLAHRLQPHVLQYCLFAHTSGEQGHQRMLDYLGARPLLQLGLRLGEGTGAALAMPLIQSAVAFLNEMASFESAGVSRRG